MYSEVQDYVYQGKFRASQKVGVEGAFQVLWDTLAAEDVRPCTVVELGTGIGGFTLYLADALPEALLFSYEYAWPDGPYEADLLARPNLTRSAADIFAPVTMAEIGALIQRPGLTLLLCDNGDKIREFHTFAPYLKPGDVIMAHDYAVEEHGGTPPWPWVEIWDSAVATAVAEHALIPFCQEVMRASVWLCRRKTGGT